MHRLDQVIVHEMRYLVWDGAEAALPKAEGVALLLSGREGVGADRLVVAVPGHPWAVRVFGADGAARAVEAADRDAAALAAWRTQAAKGTAVPEDMPFAYSEVRLTEAFFQRLMGQCRRDSMVG